MKITSWFFDFDDTLATAQLTWALNTALPKLIQTYALPADPERLARAVLAAQQRWSVNDHFQGVLSGLFEDMGWSDELQGVFAKDLRSSYQPVLFDDALELLRALNQKGHLVYVISNNLIAPSNARDLGLAAHVREIFTPHMFPGAKRKPHPSLWQAILNRYPVLHTTTPIFVGDDPWTDGAFAEACGMMCWLVDRPGRMASLYQTTPYRWVRSLREIPIT